MRYIALRKRGQQISPNKEESRRPAIYKLRRVYIHCFKRFLKFFVLFYLRKSRYRSFFLLTSDVDWKFDQWIVFTPKNENNCGGRASKLVSDKFICTYLGKANRLSVSFCGAVVMKVMDQKTLVKRRWSYKVRITVYILTLSEFARHEFANLWLETSVLDSLSLSLTGIWLGPKQARRVNHSTASLSLAERLTITEIRRPSNSVLTYFLLTDVLPL